VAQLVDELHNKPEFARSIAHRIIEIFHWRSTSGSPMTLGNSELTEICTRLFPGVKVGQCIGLTTLLNSCADCLEIWLPQTPVSLRACPGL
jgi:hypothetical protein